MASAMQDLPAAARQYGKRGSASDADSQGNKRSRNGINGCNGIIEEKDSPDRIESIGNAFYDAIIEGKFENVAKKLEDLSDEDARAVMELRFSEYAVPTMLLIPYTKAESVSPSLINSFVLKFADPHDTDIDGNSLLHLLLRRDRVNDFEALLEKMMEKEDPDFSWVRPLLTATNNEGRNPLHLAALHEHPKAVDILLRAGAEVNSKSTKTHLTALHLATMNRNHEIVKKLLGCDDISVNLKTIGNQTALDFVTENEENRELMELLQQHGAVRTEISRNNRDEETEDEESEYDESEDEDDEDEEFGVSGEDDDGDDKPTAKLVIGC